jgi:hypothetical protein
MLAPDALSRPALLLPEWHLNPTTVASLCRAFGPPTLDLFASHRSRQCKRYVTFDCTDLEAEWVDAFSRSWQRETFWLFPPPTEIPRVLQQLETASGNFYLLLPMWDSAWWTPKLVRLTSNPPWPVPDLDSVLIDLATGLPPPKVQDIRLALWTLSLAPASQTS